MLDVPLRPADLAALTELLVACVHAGASVGFLAPLATDVAEGFWRLAVVQGATLAVRDEGGSIEGVVRVLPAPLPNGRHRAEISKLLVDPRARQRGLGRRLLTAAEAAAADRGRWLLVLDTETGSAAERLYRSAGWVQTGVVEDYAVRPDGRLAPCTFLHKRLSAP